MSEAPFRPVHLPLRRGDIAIEGRRDRPRPGACAPRWPLRPFASVRRSRAGGLEGRLDSGRIGAGISLRLSPEGRLAVVGDVDFSGLSTDLFGISPDFAATLTGALDFGGSGDSPAALVADLSAAAPFCWRMSKLPVWPGCHCDRPRIRSSGRRSTRWAHAPGACRAGSRRRALPAPGRTGAGHGRGWIVASRALAARRSGLGRGIMVWRRSF